MSVDERFDRDEDAICEALAIGDAYLMPTADGSVLVWKDTTDE